MAMKITEMQLSDIDESSVDRLFRFNGDVEIINMFHEGLKDFGINGDFSTLTTYPENFSEEDIKRYQDFINYAIDQFDMVMKNSGIDESFILDTVVVETLSAEHLEVYLGYRNNLIIKGYDDLDTVQIKRMYESTAMKSVDYLIYFELLSHSNYKLSQGDFIDYCQNSIFKDKNYTENQIRDLLNSFGEEKYMNYYIVAAVEHFIPLAVGYIFDVEHLELPKTTEISSDFKNCVSAQFLDKLENYDGKFCAVSTYLKTINNLQDCGCEAA